MGHYKTWAATPAELQNETSSPAMDIFDNFALPNAFYVDRIGDIFLNDSDPYLNWLQTDRPETILDIVTSTVPAAAPAVSASETETDSDYIPPSKPSKTPVSRKLKRVDSEVRRRTRNRISASKSRARRNARHDLLQKWFQATRLYFLKTGPAPDFNHMKIMCMDYEAEMRKI